MLTKEQNSYLLSLPKEVLDRKIDIYSYDPNIKTITESIIEKIRQKFPKADIKFMGASALEISGQNDIDIYILSSPDLKNQYIEELSKYLGNYDKNEWKWIQDGYEITVYISDPMDVKTQEQVKIFEIFKNNPQILKEYEKIKTSMNGKSYKEYQIAKYKFYNKILNVDGN